MAVTESDLMGLEVTTERKPERSGGVSVSNIPAMLVKFLEAEAPKALEDPKNNRLTLRLPVGEITLPEGTKPINDKSSEAEKEVHAQAVARATDEKKKQLRASLDQLALYARGWGNVQEPKLYMTRVQNTKDEKESGEPVVHIKVQLDSDVPANNRPGRTR